MVNKTVERAAEDAKERIAYGVRFRAAIGPLTDKPLRAKLNELAPLIGMSYTYLAKVHKVGTLMGAKPNSILAHALGVDSDWLATGKGEAHSKRIWPFDALTPEQWSAAPANLREAVEKMLSTAPPEPPPARPSQKKPAVEQRVDQKPMFIHDLHRNKDKLIQWLPVPAEFLSAGKKR